MERVIEGIDEDGIKFLQIFNFVNSHPQLKSLAEEIQEMETASNDEFTKFKLQTTRKTSESEGLKLISYLETKKSLNTILNQHKPIRIYMDGVFDIIHSGHFNAIRQSKKLGDILVVGVNSDADVLKSKGPTLMNIKERAALAYACKWVDEVVEDTPYTPTVQLLDELNIDFCAHGDDMPQNESGVGCYDEIIKAGRMKIFKRTEGISTTEIIGRLLSCTKGKKSEDLGQVMTSSEMIYHLNHPVESTFSKGPVISNFLTTSWRIAEFSNNKIPKEHDKVVYIDGAFDILHIGHIETLKKARELGDFLYVGLHDDTTVNKYRGKSYPILNLQERVFNLLALKYVDEVVIGAPWVITEDLIKSLKIDIVCQGSFHKHEEEYDDLKPNVDDPYHIPKELNIYHDIKSDFMLDNEVLITRILKNRDLYVKKYMNKSQKEIEYFQHKNYLQEI